MSSKFGKIKNPALKKQWLKDLESGNLQQCQETLCYQGSKNSKASYCCLGVLGRSIQRTKAFKVVFSKEAPSVPRDLSFNGETCDTELPNNLRREVGITEYGMQWLVNMNDDDGKNFKEIAAWIRKHL
jgi:hypothetical protein